MVDTTFAEAVEKKIKTPFKKRSLELEEYYNHPTYTIKSLSEYVELVSKISECLSKVSCGDTIIYRGLSRDDYDLSPALSRLPFQHELEQNMVNDFLTRRPDAFHGLTWFDTLAKMQHYGLPTRLLDFTINPLVALYFACEKLKTRNGRIVCHCAYLQNDSAPLVSSICEAIFEKPFDSNYTIDQYICNETLPLKRYLREIYLCNELTIVRPKYWNQRIANQGGVFVVFPNDLVDRYYGVLLHVGDLGIEGAIHEFGQGSISRRAIKRICREADLDYLEETTNAILTDQYARKLVDAYSDEGLNYTSWELFTERFRMISDLKPISNEMIHDNFCSIIIEKRSKQKILDDLAHVGIGTDYIYPELEYTAKEIVQQHKR